MLRMEIALILVNAFIAYIYFSAGRKSSLLHKIFSGICKDKTRIATLKREVY